MHSSTLMQHRQRRRFLRHFTPLFFVCTVFILLTADLYSKKGEFKLTILITKSKANDDRNSSLHYNPTIPRHQDFETVETISNEQDEHASISKSNFHLPPKSLKKVAICLVGGAREFELTGPSILKYLIAGYGNEVDVFVHAPLDENTWKLSALFPGANQIVSVQITDFFSIILSNYPVEILRVRGSMAGIQGLLHYFFLVEGCANLIQQHEQTNGGMYEWVVRARMDAFWSGPPPPLSSLPGPLSKVPAITVPHGSAWGGVNDRFSIGTRNATWPTLLRLSLLPLLAKNNYDDLNSEKGLLAQTRLFGIRVVSAAVNFCLLSRRTYYGLDLPVTFLGSNEPLNGAKCRPCKPHLTGKQADAWLKEMIPPEKGGWIGPTGDGVQLCPYSKPWPSNWKHIFDSVAGEDLARQRRDMATISSSSSPSNFVPRCIAKLEKFKRMITLWNAPLTEAICVRSWLKKPRLIGQGNNTWHVFKAPLKHNSTVFSIGFEQSPYWELSLLENFPKLSSIQINYFDFSQEALRLFLSKKWKGRKKNITTPEVCMKSITHADGRDTLFPHAWVYYPWLFFSYHHNPMNEIHFPFDNHLGLDLEEEFDGAKCETCKFPLLLTDDPVKNLSCVVDYIVSHLSMTEIAVLKVDKMAVWNAISRVWMSAKSSIRVCQLLVKFFPSESNEAMAFELKRRMVDLGMILSSCLQEFANSPQRCTYFSPVHCLNS